MAQQPRINSALVAVIRMAKTSKNANSAASATAYHYIRNNDRPDKAFTTERAKKAGKANASSGQIFVTIAPDHFGPIPPKNDPKRNLGVFVGETWEDRFECRQWGAHFPHVAGIAGQSAHGAQSVALSGGYIDDEDHGEWFLYTGSGGRDLSGNKRTNKEQSSDQKFEKMNAALRVSCMKGYPVRVVRSHKEKRSSYAPLQGVRYDGVYRIEKCWRRIGVQGTYKVCRYLFVRCDNEPAPWTSDIHGDRPRPLPKIKELQGATDITERKGSPSWDYDEKEGWKWMKPPPISKKPILSGDAATDKEIRKVQRRAHMSVAERLLKEFGCSICQNVIKEPLTTPCAHNFCKTCLLGAYDNQSSMKERSRGGRTLRAQKIVKKCPSCPTDICDFLENPQINREMMDLIESLLSKAAEDCGKDADESGDGGSTDEIDDSLGKEEDDSSLNEEDKENKIGCLNGDSDVSADGPVVKIVVESKKREGDSEKQNDVKKIKTCAAVVDMPVEDNAVKQRQPRKGLTKLENKEESGKQVHQKREGRTDIVAADDGKRTKTGKRKGVADIVATDGGKRMKTGAAAGEDNAVSGTPVKQSMKIDEHGGSLAASSPRRVTRNTLKPTGGGDCSPVVISPRRATRSSTIVEAGGSPASRTRSNTKADADRSR